MGAPAKFLFDTDFAAPERTREKAATAAEIAQKVAEAEARAYQDGIAAGIGNIESKMETEAVDVAVAVARKLCADLVAAEPLGEIMALVKDCFSHLVATPHLVVRINDQLYEAAREKIERLAKQSGFEGRLVILAEPEIATGDCRIEWADGGVVLERSAIAAKIDDMVGRYIASRRGS